MSNERRKAQAARSTQHLPVATLPEMTRRWRRLARIRNLLIGIWLGGLACTLACLSQMFIFHSIGNQLLDLAFALEICWIGACGALVCLFSLLKKHLEQTFLCNDITCLGCWIDTLFGAATGSWLPRGTQEYQLVYAEAKGCTDLFQLLDMLGALIASWFGSGCALSLFERTARSKGIAKLSRWMDLPFARTSTARSPIKAADKHQWLYTQARQELLEQLPRLQEDTVYLLDIDERHLLYKSLFGNDAELISVVLQVIPLLGDSRALPFVQHLAEGKGLAARETGLQAEAQASLQQLQANLERSSGVQALLRASHPPQTPEEQLLTPAHANSETDVQELLRADTQQ